MTDAKRINDYLYCIEIVGGDIAKVGVSSSPKCRLGAICSTAPFEMRLTRVIGFTSRRVADAWERYIISNANRYRGHGEWVLNDERLNKLFGGVTEGFDVTAEIDNGPLRGRLIPAQAAIGDVQEVIVRERTKGTDLTGIKFSGGSGEYTAAIVKARLRQGYGADDISVMDKIPASEVRECISEIRTSGEMEMVLFGPMIDAAKEATQ